MTPMIPIDDFIPLVTKHARGFNDLAVTSALRTMGQHLCEAADIWRDTVTFAITQPAGQTLGTIEDAQIERIETAFLDGQKLMPVTLAWLDENRPIWRVDTDTAGSARYVTQLMEDQISVYPLATGTMKACFILKPSDEADNMPAVLKSKYPEELGRGAAAILLTSEGSPNPQLGLDHRQWAEGRLSSIKIKTFRGQQRGEVRTKPNWF